MTSIPKSCKIENCTNLWALNSKTGKRYLTKGYCKIHYNRYWLYKDTSYNYYTSRPHIKCDGYVKIPTNIEGKYLLLDNDFSHVDDRLWSIDSHGYVASRRTRAHVMVMGKQKKGMDIDHINGDKLDNRRQNLRVVSHRHNSHNQKLSKSNTTGYRGVWVDNQGSKPMYNAQISKYIDGKKKTIIVGRFKTAKEAAIARDKAVIEHYSKYAPLNLL